MNLYDYAVQLQPTIFRQTNLGINSNVVLQLQNAVSKLGSLEAKSRPLQTFKVDSFATTING